jgi:hypothetical protein
MSRPTIKSRLMTATFLGVAGTQLYAGIQTYAELKEQANNSTATSQPQTPEATPQTMAENVIEIYSTPGREGAKYLFDLIHR